MSRLHRKCLAASTTAHGLLLLILLIGSAFTDPRPEPFNLPLLVVIPDKIVDAAIYGGGEPKPAPPSEQAAAPAPVPTPVPEQPQKAPEPKVEPKPQAQPQPSEPAPTPAPKTKGAEPRPAAAKPKIQVAPIKSQAAKPKRAAAETGIQPKVAEDLKSRFSSTASRLGSKLTPRTTIGVPGDGNGAFANYSQVVISIYRQQWIKPIGIEQTATVKATVVIARDGRVVSTRITRLSGNPTVDDSVERVLQRVKTVAPFPKESTDTTRTFELSFELIPADLSG